MAKIEDAAQAAGAAWKGQPVGAIGDIGTFSFQSTKGISSGEGGRMLTNAPALDEMLWSLRNVGRRRGGERYEHIRLGWNLRMTEFQGAVALAQMGRMSGQRERRAASAAYLTDHLEQIPGIRAVRHPAGVTSHSWYSYHFRWLAAQDGGLPKMEFAKALRAEGIPVFHGYVPLNRNQAICEEIARLGGREPAPCPAAELASNHEVLNFPLPILMSDRRDLDDVVAAVAKVAAYRA